MQEPRCVLHVLRAAASWALVPARATFVGQTVQYSTIKKTSDEELTCAFCLLIAFLRHRLDSWRKTQVRAEAQHLILEKSLDCFLGESTIRRRGLIAPDKTFIRTAPHHPRTATG